MAYFCETPPHKFKVKINGSVHVRFLFHSSNLLVSVFRTAAPIGARRAKCVYALCDACMVMGSSLGADHSYSGDARSAVVMYRPLQPWLLGFPAHEADISP